MASEVSEKGFPKKEFSEKDLEHLWQSSLHEDELFSQRTNFLVLTQTVLLFAFGAIVGNAVAGMWKYVMTLGILGIATSLLWIYTSYKADKYTIRAIRNIIVETPNFSLYAQIVKDREKNRKFGSNIVFGIFFPVMFIIAWLFLMVIALTA